MNAENWDLWLQEDMATERSRCKHPRLRTHWNPIERMAYASCPDCGYADQASEDDLLRQGFKIMAAQ